MASINPHDPSFLDQVPQFPPIPDLDTPPSLHEVSKAVQGLKNNKAFGPDGIPGEIFKYGGQYLLHRLHRFILLTWNSKQLPQQWKDANIITIFKRIGDQAVCGNSRGSLCSQLCSQNTADFRSNTLCEENLQLRLRATKIAFVQNWPRRCLKWNKYCK